jgi:enoyl-[acyl-carrier protein] reductase I
LGVQIQPVTSELAQSFGLDRPRGALVGKVDKESPAAKAGLESVSRYLARDLGPRGIRVNLVAAGPLETLAAGGIPGFEQLASHWVSGAPLGWDTTDPSPTAAAVCFLLSEHARAITGEILHVDGGYHSTGAPIS